MPARKGGGQVLPWECRLGRESYQAQMHVTLKCSIAGKTLSVERQVGPIPVMVGSKHCYLSRMSAQQKVQRGREEGREAGGYFIINGNEKVVRLLAAQRAHMPFALERPTLSKVAQLRQCACAQYRWR